MKKSTLSRKQNFILASVVLAIGLVLIVLGYIFNLKSIMAKGWIYTFYIIGAIVLFIGSCYLYALIANKNKLNTKQMTLIGLMSALTVILYYFVKFNLPFFPGWLDIQVSEIPALITTFAYGPYAGSMVIIIRFIIKLPATITAGVGELADLILGLALVIICGVVYRKHHTLKGALIGMGAAMVFCTFLALATNYFILIPAYVNLAHYPLEALAGMLSYMGNVTVDNFMLYYLFVGVLPFNLFRYALVYLLTFILYKRVKYLLDKLK